MSKVEKKTAMRKLGIWLKEKRESAGMSRGTLAAKVKTTYETIRLYEEGKRSMRIERFMELLSALGLEVDDLCNREV